MRGRKLKRVPKSGESLTNGVYYQVSWEATFSSCLGIIYITHILGGGVQPSFFMVFG